MINYIYNQLYNLQGWLVRVSDCEELVGATHRRKDVACWWRWRPPLLLILLTIFKLLSKIPTKIPTNDRLRFNVTNNLFSFFMIKYI